MIQNLLAKIKFTLFGSENKTVYDDNKSIHQNFDGMCSLSFFKIRSKQTHQLVNILKTCTLTAIQKPIYALSQDERRRDIVTLERAKLALKNWHNQRDQLSTRLHLIRNFETIIHAKQHYLIQFDYRAFLTQQKIERKKLASWIHPLYDHQVQNYLNKSQQKSVDEVAVNTRNKWSKLSYAFLPFLNTLMDWDFVFDGFNTCIDLASLW